MPADKPTELSRIKLKNLNSTARPYDQQAFSPLDLTASWLSHLALVIYMFAVVNFDALAQASDIRIERRQVVFLLNAGFEPKVSDTYSPADWMPADKSTECVTLRWPYTFCIQTIFVPIKVAKVLIRYKNKWYQVLLSCLLYLTKECVTVSSHKR